MSAASVESITARLAELSKTELVDQLAKLKVKGDTYKVQHEGMVNRVLTVFAQEAVAVGAGATAGLLELKMPCIPKTRVRIDLLTSTLLATANLIGLTGKAQPVVQSAADALTGHGVGRVTERFAEKRLGIKRTAPRELPARAPRIAEEEVSRVQKNGAATNGASRAAA